MNDSSAKHNTWSAGQSYELYMGRWSGEIAIKFIDWLEVPRSSDGIDIGFGARALTQAILERCSPKLVAGVEPSEGFVCHARETVRDAKDCFEIASAGELLFEAASFDISTSVLALNFVPDKT